MENSKDGQREERVDVTTKQIEVPSPISREEEEYNMKHPRRGVALIFNHKHFRNMGPRKGSDKDVAALTNTFQNLGFETRIHIDLPREEFFDVLKKTAKEDHGDCDCLVVTVMSHGDPGYIYCYDVSYATEKLWEHFTADKCPTLASKPKLFFVQACRGDKADAGVRVQLMATRVDDVHAWYTLPTKADILVAYSTVEGYLSWRSMTDGSWFIQTLCEELDKHGRKRDLLSILTFVSRRVAFDYQSSVQGTQNLDSKKQVPAFSSMLTRRVIFR